MVKKGDYPMTTGRGYTLFYQVDEVRKAAPKIYTIGVTRVKPYKGQITVFGKMKHLALREGMSTPYGTARIGEREIINSRY